MREITIKTSVLKALINKYFKLFKLYQRKENRKEKSFLKKSMQKYAKIKYLDKVCKIKKSSFWSSIIYFEWKYAWKCKTIYSNIDCKKCEKSMKFIKKERYI